MNAVEVMVNGTSSPRARRLIQYSSEIPEGWWKLMRRRQSGISKNRFDTYLIAPDGKRMRSSIELWKYLAVNNIPWPETCCNTKTIFSQKHAPLVADNVDEIWLENNPTAPKIAAPITSSDMCHNKVIKSNIKQVVDKHLLEHSYYFPQRSSVNHCSQIIESDNSSEIIESDNECQIVAESRNGILRGTISEYLASKFDIDSIHSDTITSASVDNLQTKVNLPVQASEVKQTERVNLTSQLSNICLNSTPLSNVEEGTLRQYEIKQRKWIPPKSPFNLIQETLFHDPWQLLLATIFLTKTEAQRATESFYRFIERWPTADDIIEADINELSQFITPLGFHRLRAYSIKKFSYEFRHKSWEDPIQLFGIGKYGSDSYKIFVTGEWQNCEPQDHMLQKYVHWLATNHPAPSCSHSVDTQNS